MPSRVDALDLAALMLVLALIPASAVAELTVLNLAASRNLSKVRNFGPCKHYSPAPGPLRGNVGFGQAEIDGDGENCMAITLQKALMFDLPKLKQLNAGPIDSAFIVFDEKEAPLCPLVADNVKRTCWQSGGGRPEQKPQGCVLVKVPSVNWIRDSSSSGEMPTLENAPQIRRVASGRYDATEALRWQVQGASLGSSRGVGFLLQGHIPFGRLTAQDNTICISQVSNIRMEVNYRKVTGGHSPVR